MRVLVAAAGLVIATPVSANSPIRWRDAAHAPSLVRVWGRGDEVYGAGAGGAYRSIDGGVSWTRVDPEPARAVWGSADEVWVVRARTLARSRAGGRWTTHALPMLSFTAVLDGMWGIARERYAFGSERLGGRTRGVILHSRDAGTSWRSEALPDDVERIAGMWGSAANDVYAVGAPGVVLHWTGDGWRPSRVLRSGSLEAIWGRSANEIYAVGSTGAIVVSRDRGRTWTSRHSGVRYRLSSITGTTTELFAGSGDGAPLRSADGTTWRPLTAMIENGDVWADLAGHVVVAAPAGGVHSLGEIAPIVPDLSSLPEPVAEARRRARHFGARYPAARDLFLLAARLLADPKHPPRDELLRAGRLPMRFGQIIGCGPAVDREDPSSRGSDELVFELRCSKPCANGGQIRQTTTWLRDGERFESSIDRFTPDPGWCGAPEAVVSRTYKKFLSSSLAVLARVESEAQARAGDARIDAYAHYVLGGGPDRLARLRLAELVDRDVRWPGFFWNHPVVPTVRIASPWIATPLTSASCSDPPAVASLEKAGDQLLARGRSDLALAKFAPIASCNPRIAEKAYVAACRAHDFVAAKSYLRLAPAAPAAVCLDNGFDPRAP